MDIFKNIMLLIVSPRVGWEDINAGGIATSRIMRVAFFPLLALLAISAFMPMLHDHTLTLSKSLMTAIIQFSSFFFSYYIVCYLLAGFYPELVKTNGSTARLHELVLYSLIYLVLLAIITNVLPIDFTPIFFIMTYLVWIIYRGVRYMGLEKPRQTGFLIATSALLLLTPFVIQQLLSMLIVK
ncbi:MAG: hypothetical protein J5980_08355 [Muribaculaceae bacterium]|nr:hypothetical protein [Muribaculaceae bacterium]